MPARVKTHIGFHVYFNAVHDTASCRDEMGAVLTTAAVYGKTPWSMCVYALIDCGGYFNVRRRAVYGARRKVDSCVSGLRVSGK